MKYAIHMTTTFIESILDCMTLMKAQVRPYLTRVVAVNLARAAAVATRTFFLERLDDEHLKPMTRANIARPLGLLEKILLHAQALMAATKQGGVEPSRARTPPPSVAPTSNASAAVAAAIPDPSVLF